MKLVVFPAILGLVVPTFSQYTAVYDTLYDGTQTSLSSVACSTGQYGLIPQGYNTFGDLPSYPFIGGAPSIEWWDSSYCGSCWSLTYTDPQGNPWSVNLTAINSGTGTQGGFTISFAGMDILTNGNSLRLDGVSISAVMISGGLCT